MAAEVELDVFSGRPNPKWKLAPEFEHMLAEHVRRLNREAPRHPKEGGLGYRGLVVRSDRLPEIRVSRGVVEVDHAYWEDPNHELERLLLNSGRSSVDESLIDAVARDLDSGSKGP